MKKIIFTLFLVALYAVKIQAQYEIGYETRYLGMNLSDAESSWCSGNVSNSGVLGRFNVLSSSENPLTLNKLYKRNEDGEIRYYYIVKKNANAYSDRDSFLSSSFTMLNPLCETGYETRYLGTNESNAKSIVCSGNASSSGSLSRFNVLSSVGGSPLETGKLYKRNEDGVIAYHYIVRKNTTTYSDRDSFFVSNFTKLVPFCDNDNDGVENSVDNCVNSSNPNQADSDSDGIGNVCDSCPNQAGPASNNGCPVQQGKPDFIITEIKVNGIAAPNLKLKANSNNKFCVSIKNIGSATGTIDNTALILTNSAGLTNSSIVANLPYPSTTLTIVPNEVKEMCAELYIWNDYLGYSLSSFHYIHAIADYHERVSESDENNNTTVESIGYSSKTAIISVNNFQGIEIKRETIKNSEEEKELLNSLPKGFYILNKDGKRTKIYKEN